MNDQQLIARLREKGFRVTPQRLAICEFVLSSKEHPTVDQVYHAVQRKHPTLSLATVYQTLHLLTELGMLQELGFSDGVSRYDARNSPHINIVCRSCGKIQDYESESIRNFLSQIAVELKRPLMGQRLEMYACCDRCMESGVESAH
jgi:Fur family peroxide stress response transcriptional regulator